jgi:hypothetical protein
MSEILTIEQVIQMLRDRILSNGGLRRTSEQAGVSIPWLSKVVRGYDAPGPKVCKYLGIRLVQSDHYERIEP